MAKSLAGVAVVVRSAFNPDVIVPIVHAIIDAQALALRLRAGRELVPPVLKDDQTLVTAADLAVQAIVAGEIRRCDPRTPIVAEEDLKPFGPPDGGKLADAVMAAVRSVRPALDLATIVRTIGACSHDTCGSEYWALDPIDGTTGFIRGEHFSIALARIRAGAVVLAILACPTLSPVRRDTISQAGDRGVVFIVVRGGGAWQLAVGGDRDALTHVHLSTPEPAAFRVCESVEAGHSDRDAVARIIAHAGAQPATLRVDGQTKYALVARGEAEAYLRVPVLKSRPDAIWDHAAGSLLATEAGAMVTDLRGEHLDFGQGARLFANAGVICAHPALHERLVDAVTRSQLDAGRCSPR